MCSYDHVYSILFGEARDDLDRKVTSEEKPRGIEGIIYAGIGGKNCSGREERCKGPEVSLSKQILI